MHIFFLFAVSFNLWMTILSSSASVFIVALYIILLCRHVFFIVILLNICGECLMQEVFGMSLLNIFFTFFLRFFFVIFKSYDISFSVVTFYTVFVYVSAAENRLILEMFRNYSCHFVEGSFIRKILMYRMTKCLYNID